MSNIQKNLNELEWLDSSHSGILKKVFFKGEDFTTKITQVAYTKLERGTKIEFHKHESMEEVFFILAGSCEFKIGESVYLLKDDSIIRVPIDTFHSLHAITNCELFYFGVST